jgi:hypothetical protein
LSLRCVSAAAAAADDDDDDDDDDADADAVGNGEVWAAGSNVDGQLGLGSAFGARNAEFRLVRVLQGEFEHACELGYEHGCEVGHELGSRASVRVTGAVGGVSHLWVRCVLCRLWVVK